ncbi:TetR/AcrR family transcriptional regulator [Crossiella sp. NPDC003009]
MGHREDLLAGAKRCLLERGYARTTARDIVAASGTNLASIGYHFGSKEALLTQAMIEALTESTEAVSKALPIDNTAPARDRLETAWHQVSVSTKDAPAMWRASLEAFLVGAQQPEVLEVLRELHAFQRRELTAELLGVPAEQVDEEQAGTLGALLLAMATGLSMQTMVNPEHAPTAKDMAAGLRRLAEVLDAG